MGGGGEAHHEQGHGHEHHHHEEKRVPKLDGFREYTGVMKSRSVEEWAHYRENTTNFFRVKRFTAVAGVVFGLAVPFLIFKAHRDEQRKNLRRMGMSDKIM